MLPLLIRYIPKPTILELNKTDLIFKLKNNSEIILAGANNYDSLRGLGYDFAAIDEVKDVPAEAWFEVIRPALSDKQGSALICGTPYGKSNWFYDIHTDSIFSSYSFKTIDGGWVKAEEIESAKNEMDIRTFRQEFEASFESIGASVYYTFSDYNITNVSFNPSVETHLCWDFNTGEKPMSCLISQHYDNKVYIPKEFIYHYSNTQGMCEAVYRWLIDNNFTGNLTITGDNTGHFNKSAASRSDYQIIEQWFKNFKGYDVKTRAVKSIRDRVASLNSMLENANGEHRLFIDKSCKYLIDDLRRVEWRENGTQLDDRDPERTHPSDALSYDTYNFYPIRSGQEVFRI
jgi:hypothetical protein